MSLYNNLIRSTSTLGKNVIKTPTHNNITPGVDYVVFDTWDEQYKILKGKSYEPSSFDNERYLTNFDIVIGARDNTIHAVACDDAYGYNNMVSSNAAAAACYYRIEIDTSTDGGFSFTASLGNYTITNSITWNAKDTLQSILEVLKQQISEYESISSCMTYVILDDNSGIGVACGGYGDNTYVISNVTGNVNLIDMSLFAVYDKGVLYGDKYNSELTVINDKHKSWRGYSVQSIMGADIIPIGPNSLCYANNGLNYYYGNGINYKGFRSWCSTNGTNIFNSDGVNGSTHSTAYVYPMNKTVFEESVNANAAVESDAYKMYVYYNNLLNSIGAEFTEKHDLYVSRYGEMVDLYGAYLMAHMVLTDEPTGGILYTSKGLGKTLTQNKSKIFTLTYNYTYYPAYPPEYNCSLFGVNDDNHPFGKGKYYHPEPYDLSLIFRDDILELINKNFISNNFKVTQLLNSSYRGSCCEYNSVTTWYFYGPYRLLYASIRYWAVFRCRPVFAFNF